MNLHNILSSSKYLQHSITTEPSPLKNKSLQYYSSSKTHHYPEIGQQAKKENFELRVKYFDEGLLKNLEGEELKFQSLKEKLLKLKQSIDSLKSQNSLIQEKHEQNIKRIETIANAKLEEEKNQKKDLDTQIFVQIDQKLQQARVQINNQAEINEDNLRQQNNIFTEQIDEVRENIGFEKRSREENTEKIISRLGEQILSLQEMITYEKKIREEGQNRIVSMLEELEYTTDEKLDNEKNIRENNETVLLRLLEETCTKIETTLQN